MRETLNQDEQVFVSENKRTTMIIKKTDSLKLKGYRGIFTVKRLPLYKEGIVNDCFIILSNGKNEEVLFHPDYIVDNIRQLIVGEPQNDQTSFI